MAITIIERPSINNHKKLIRFVRRHLGKERKLMIWLEIVHTKAIKYSTRTSRENENENVESETKEIVSVHEIPSLFAAVVLRSSIVPKHRIIIGNFSLPAENIAPCERNKIAEEKHRHFFSFIPLWTQNRTNDERKVFAFSLSLSLLFRWNSNSIRKKNYE